MMRRELAFLAIVMGLAVPAAQAAPGDAKTEPTPTNAAPAGVKTGCAEVKVGIYVLSLGKLDIASGSYTVDFYLNLQSTEPIPDNTFEFMNGRAATIEKIEDTNGGKVKFYRILANLNVPVDLKRFPFDQQKLSIVLENKTEGINKVKYVADMAQSGLDPGIWFPGWFIAGWAITDTVHDYSVYHEKYSQFVFSVDIARVRLNSFLKTFLPVIFLMLIVMSSFILNPEQISTRLAAISSALVASAMFHISIAGQIPPVGYLTFADKFMILTYFILLACFFISLRVFILQAHKEEERAKKLSKLTEKIVFAGMPTLYVALFMWDLYR